MRRVLVLGDSLAFHGPSQPELLTEPRLFPNVMARQLGVEVDVIAGFGWTAREAWWALTKNPYVYSVLLPRADAVVLAIGGSDKLPASLPGYLRDGIAYLRPDALRKKVALAYHRAHPYVVRLTGGRMRMLSMSATDSYLTQIVEALRYVRPDLPVVAMVPPVHAAPYHAAIDRHRVATADAHRAWGERLGVPLVDTEEIITPFLRAGRMNPDLMHWSWEAHAEVGAAFAETLAKATAGLG